MDGTLLPRQESFASLHILTRRASEGSEAFPSLARRVRMSFFGARVIVPMERALGVRFVSDSLLMIQANLIRRIKEPMAMASPTTS